MRRGRSLGVPSPVVALSVAGVVALASAGAAWWFSRPEGGGAPPPHVWTSTLSKALEEIPLVATLDVGELDAAFPDRSLWDPASLLPDARELGNGALRALDAYAATCVEGDAGNSADAKEDGALAKAWAFQRAVCRQESLPASFFEAPPYLHPAGVSFAVLAEEAGMPAPARTKHLLEGRVGNLPDGAGGTLSLASTLQIPSLDALAQGADAFVDGNRFLSRAARRAGQGNMPVGMRYEVRDFAPVVRAAAEVGIELMPRRSAVRCETAWGSICLSAVPLARATDAERGVLVATALLAASFATLIVAGTWTLVVIQRARAERDFLVRLLAHEVRTPTAVLMLAAERLRDEYDALSEEGRSALMETLGAIHRLRRVINAGTAYMQVEGGLSFFDREGAGVPSLRALLAGVVEECGGEAGIGFDGEVGSDVGSDVDAGEHSLGGSLRLVHDEGDVALPQVPFWISLCAKNLVRNALAHGARPVTVGWKRDGATHVVMHVEDSGTWAKKGTTGAEGVPAPALSSPPFPSPASAGSGMGLGLSLVRRSVKGMRGTLRIRRSPTRIEIRLPRSPR